MPNLHWKVFLASAAGRHHIESALPCQDAAGHRVVGEVLLGAVCDGAGSAREGREGARFLAQQVVDRLGAAVAVGAWTPLDPESALHDVLRAVREELREVAWARRLELRDYASTLVGCVAAPQGGCFFHVGDGFGVFLGDAGQSILSRPENGEYADQTYFVTDEAWAEHLRLTPFAPIRPGGLIGLMSDGTSPFAIDRARSGFYRPFIDPVTRFLAQAGAEEGNQALLGLLEDEKTHSITADDKTLLLAMAA